MWCPACRADVAAELSLDSRHFRCARCTTELGTAMGSHGSAASLPALPTDAERNARELLARWNAQNLLSPAASKPALPVELAPPAASSVIIAETPRTSDSPGDPPTLKIDKHAAPHPGRRRRSEHRRREFELPTDIAERRPEPRVPNWGATVGQMCAYFGIGLITCGTSLVLWGYFGGPENLAPTGWLITTIGQMFLFLGVVTLISSGMEQTTAAVASRMDVLGERLIRIEMLQRKQAAGAAHGRRTKRRQDSSGAAEPQPPAAEAA